MWILGEHQTKGDRSTMEDSSLIQYVEEHNHLFVAVFDGHNGSRCSEFLKEKIVVELEQQLKNVKDLEVALKNTYLSMDRKWLDFALPEKYNDGSTGISIVIENNRIVVANTGDCRAVMYRGGQCIVLSKDHKPTDPEEMKRIEENGGQIIGDRLQGELAVSRAFGDYRYKVDERRLLICEPEINKFNITPDIEFIVVACDGLYETFSNDEVIEYVKKALEDDKLDINAIAKALADEAIDRGSGDNITVIIIKFDKKYRKILQKAENRISRKRQEDLMKEKRKSLVPLKKSVELEKQKSLEA
jgi:protein phosphatase 2C family protein 2/3